MATKGTAQAPSQAKPMLFRNSVVDTHAVRLISRHPNALYERHLMFDNVIDVAAAVCARAL